MCWEVKKCAADKVYFCSSRANFIIVLRAAFVHADPESAKNIDNLTVFFALSRSAGGNAACRTLMKLTPEIQNKVVKKMSHKMKTTFFYGRLV